jgi:polyhydroxyalkanoate synthesis repressor PhaR
MKKTVTPTLIIKRYENRRLYNTLTSQYINQEQVAQLVRDGYELRVVDAATGEDLTRLILAQIVVEDAKTPDSVFPLDVLRQMILASGRATQENALRYMKAMTDMYQNAYRALPAPINPFEFLPGRLSQPQSADRAAGSPPSEAPQPSATSARQASVSEVAELNRRIEELEFLLTKRAPKKSSRKPKKSRHKS